MEQYSQYLIQMNNNIYTHIARSSPFEHSTSSIQSREEQAFVEDVGEGLIGGFIWPPRCYSCSFCKRIFKSAQALGGHMNVHRRDRARLNQPIICPGGANKVCISDSPNPSDVLASFYSNTETVRIVRGDLVTKKLACMNHMLRKESMVEAGLSVGLNFCLQSDGAAEPEHTSDGGDIKRRRTDGGCSDQVPLVCIGCSSSDKEIDLELRLGDSPTVN